MKGVPMLLGIQIKNAPYSLPKKFNLIYFEVNATIKPFNGLTYK